MAKNSKEIVEYDIITGEDARDLQRRVAKGMEKGWVPKGGISQNKDGYPMQAVVKYKSPNQD